LLIIFDLDDTLIDTSGSITPIKLQDALQKMIENGLSVSNFSEAYEMLKRLDEFSESSRQTLAEFLEIIGADHCFFEIGVKEIYENLSPDLPIFPLDQAIEILTELKQTHELALVTVGKEHQQMAKMKKAGIDRAIFSKIVVSEERNKKPHYQSIIEELYFSPSDVIVCGDRIHIDLVPARELGFKTVHMKWGRGLNATQARGEVDYAISHLAELKQIIASIL
jgi:FMN phosphatase YigB (HAD superfamily)